MSAPAPKIGPITEGERAAARTWWASLPKDEELSGSLGIDDTLPHHLANYILIRALRAGVPLEKLL